MTEPINPHPQPADKRTIKLLTSPRTADVKAAANLKYLQRKGLVALPDALAKSVQTTLDARAAFVEQAQWLAMMRRTGALQSLTLV